MPAPLNPTRMGDVGCRAWGRAWGGGAACAGRNKPCIRLLLTRIVGMGLAALVALAVMLPVMLPVMVMFIIIGLGAGMVAAAGRQQARPRRQEGGAAVAHRRSAAAAAAGGSARPTC